MFITLLWNSKRCLCFSHSESSWMKVVSLNLRVSTVHVHDEISEVSLLSWSPFSSHISSLTSSTKPTLLITLTYHCDFLIFLAILWSSSGHSLYLTFHYCCTLHHYWFGHLFGSFKTQHLVASDLTLWKLWHSYHDSGMKQGSQLFYIPLTPFLETCESNIRHCHCTSHFFLQAHFLSRKCLPSVGTLAWNFVKDLTTVCLHLKGLWRLQT